MAKHVKSGGRASAVERASSIERTTVALLCAAAWIVPGAGHLWLGRHQKGIIFFVALSLMFALGLLLEGRIFPFAPSEPLVALAAIADLGLALPYAIAKLVGAGVGNVVSATYEYGNTFVIVAGLLNFLVIIDVFDIALGRK